MTKSALLIIVYDITMISFNLFHKDSPYFSDC